jgi:DNA-binding GntR family transcriptional regulator
MDQALADLRVSPKTVQLQTVEKLRAAIVNGVFKPGERLVESRLCTVFGVSRPPMREALRVIEAEKLITIIPNAGPIVSVLAWEDAAEIYRVRSLLEGEAACLCAQRASEEGLEMMRSALKAFRRGLSRSVLADQLAATEAFYDVLLRECGNKLVRDILDGLMARINLLRVRSMSLRLRSRSSAQEMEAILQAIEARDADGARAAAISHVENACASAKIIYDQQVEGQPLGDDGARKASAGSSKRRLSSGAGSRKKTTASKVA